jgi:hypothetical protein
LTATEVKVEKLGILQNHEENEKNRAQRDVGIIVLLDKGVEVVEGNLGKGRCRLGGDKRKPDCKEKGPAQPRQQEGDNDKTHSTQKCGKVPQDTGITSS